MPLKKIFTCIVLLLLLAGQSQAQNAQLEAKAAYLLAEESYGKGEMRAALDYINEAAGKLGVINAKLSYLKVMILKEMSIKDPSALTKLDTAVVEFEKAPDLADFNEQKTLEIVKIKLERRQKNTAAAALEQQIAAYQKKIGWSIGISTDSMIVLQKEKFDVYFKNNPKLNGKLKPTENIMFWEKGNISEIIALQNGLLFSYSKFMPSFTDETVNFDKSKQVETAVLNELRNALGYVPEPTVTTTSLADGGSTSAYLYTWKSAKITLMLGINRTATKSMNISSGVVVLSSGI